MATVSMKVEKVKDAGVKNWYAALGSVNGFKVRGFGNTVWRAMKEAFADYWERWSVDKGGFIRI